MQKRPSGLLPLDHLLRSLFYSIPRALTPSRIQGSAQDEWDGPEDEELPEELGAQRCSPTEEVRFPAPPARARTPEARPPDRLALPSALRFSPPPGRRSARPPDMRFP